MHHPMLSPTAQTRKTLFFSYCSSSAFRNAVIFIICNGFQPYGRPLFPAGNSDLNERGVCTCTMPVRNIRRTFDHISFPEYYLRPAFFLIITYATRSKQYLPSRVQMPFAPCARLEGYIAYAVLI